ncbi:hypothetical protein U1Q18_000516 [Sarracenia purpurea var. burkii]
MDFSKPLNENGLVLMQMVLSNDANAAMELYVVVNDFAATSDAFVCCSLLLLPSYSHGAFASILILLPTLMVMELVVKI